MKDKRQKYLTILALSLSGGSIYLLPYLKYVFYDQQLAVMGINNQQSDLLLTMYAMGCMLVYIPGGMVADRFSAKKCILFSLISTTVLALLYAFTFNYKLSLVIWLLLAITTTFVFWSSLMKTIRLIADDDEQGRMFGLYYAGNGITGAIGNSTALWAAGLSSDPCLMQF
ncbi:Major Facilitator Superfamily protein [Desulfonispora thiosulfatigenes DSM 11270]|uniref:Major Facilitator Superfamily protein n=1 Tax=Desulfonispora thiosulfatigenes DSM 11270 TaxID=656914 RepID=A0A1W1VP50_DESTI|nr:MFS transporter [Desulfonispora thiosulfatigenes]SMB95152.1 Major Facilitator Superfamily protein [Desulfonispora thiosulfatigenes DSM 11270]